MVSTNIDLNKWYDSLKDQALNRNDKGVITWIKYKSDLEVTKSLLSSIPKKVSHKVMVPLGPKALVPGRIVHTNEFLVNLGEAWFVKRSAAQTSEICDRRIKSCDEMLRKLEKERELILNRSKLPTEKEAFGNEERPEIIEYVTEEEDEAWRKQHRKNEKKYRQQLAELKTKERKPIATEEDLWKHLDELELQEELEDELNRLNANESEEESESEPENEPEAIKEDENSSKNEVTKTVPDRKSSRRVSFAGDFDSSDDEPLRLEIKHTNYEPEPSGADSKIINSPADIYKHYLETLKKTPWSVLKSDKNPNEKLELEMVKNAESYSDDEMFEGESKEISDDQLIMFEKTPMNVLSDVVERNSLNARNQVAEENVRKVSKFKASRKKNF